jgi:hypothetical protein
MHNHMNYNGFIILWFSPLSAKDPSAPSLSGSEMGLSHSS